MIVLSTGCNEGTRNFWLGRLKCNQILRSLENWLRKEKITGGFFPPSDEVNMDTEFPEDTAKFMYRFGCRDVGADCDYVVTATSVEEVKDQWFAHVYVAHAEIMGRMNEVQTAELSQRVVTFATQRRSAIR